MTETAPAVIKRSLAIAGHATSVSLEEPFWRALREMAAREGVTVAALVARIDGARGSANLSSAIRVCLLEDALARTVSSPASGPEPGRQVPARRQVPFRREAAG
jgi:predicted DNA-binding ribbon-helix-helix protein